ncbi:MAG: hypothetical protein ACFFG0_06650 [Candidatus Thorarchaeota archaeon]
MSKEVSTVIGIPNIDFQACSLSSSCNLVTITPTTLPKLKINGNPVHTQVFCSVAGMANNPGPPPPPTLPCGCSGNIPSTPSKIKVSGQNVNRKDDQIILTPSGPGLGATVKIKDNTNNHKLMTD